MAERLFKWGTKLKMYDCDPYMTDYLYTHRKKSTKDQWNTTLSHLSESSWIYIGELQFHISEQILCAYFSVIGCIQELIFGVNANNHSQKIGFAFIKYATHQEACSAVDCLDGTILLEKAVKVQLDPGFEEGRQFGRGKTGHQRYKEKERTLRKIEKKLKSKHFKELDEKKKVNELVDTLNSKITLNENENVTIKTEEKKVENEENEIEKESEFDIVIPPPKKKRRMDPKIAKKLKYVSQKIDDENYRKRMKRNHEHDDDFDDIINMMKNTMSEEKNECVQKKEITKKKKGKKRKGNKKRKTYKAKPKKMGSLSFEELMKQYDQFIGKSDADKKNEKSTRVCKSQLEI